MPILLAFLENTALLGFLGFGYVFLERNRKRLGDQQTNILFGLNCGLVAFLVAANPVVYDNGARLDAGAGPVILASVMSGPVGGLIAAMLSGFARSLAGGSYVLTGIIVCLLYALGGVGLRAFGLVLREKVGQVRSIMLMILVSLVATSLMFFFITPFEQALDWAQKELPFIFIANALSVAISAAMVGLALRYLATSASVEELNERLDLANRAGGFGVWDYDIRKGVLTWDERAQKMHGVFGDTFTGTSKDWLGTIHPEDRSKVKAYIRDASPTQDFYQAEYRVSKPDGTQRSIRNFGIILRDQDGAPQRIVGTNIDVTTLRRAEVQLTRAQSLAQQAQKFESIGKMTGGVAHDFNNLLAVIMGNQELLRDEIQTDGFDPDGAIELIDASLDATKRGAELTQNMLSYARQAKLTPARTNLNEVVDNTSRWLRRTIESNIEIDTVLQRGLWPSLLDQGSLQNALVNMLVNARDAIEGSGKVRIETRNIVLTDEDIRQSDGELHPGRYVMLSVTDSGSGIAPEQIEQVFDPFYTTKQTGKGTGLGLSMVQGFVKQSGGTVRVRSRLGTGTCFTVFFPAVEEVVSSLVEPKVLDQPRSQTRILLVEDQSGVLAVLKKTLNAAGFDVEPVETADEALRLFRSDPDFDLVVTDVVVPGKLQGPSLATELRRIVPGLKFIFLSGYSSESIHNGNDVRPDDLRLMKPVSRGDLLQAVRDTLDRPETPATATA